MTQDISGAALTAEDRAFVARAAHYLENPSFLMTIANYVGKPIEALSSALPEKQAQAVAKAVHGALNTVTGIALKTIPDRAPAAGGIAEAESAGWWTGLFHNAATAVSGAAGGLFGFAGLAVELPVTTTIMLRSIASIAQDFGEDLSTPGSRLQCITVFSLGARGKEQDAMESSYFVTRTALARLIGEASTFLAKLSAEEMAEAVAKGTAPALVRLIGKVAARFNIVVSEKALAQVLPVIGALGGAFVNVAFTDHFNSVALYHFGLRRLERHYEKDAVEQVYKEAMKKSRPKHGGKA